MTRAFLRTQPAAPAAVVVGVVAGLAGTAAADDIVPPPWQRLTPFTTVQEWDFNAPGNIAPDGDEWGNYFNQNPQTDIPEAKPGPTVTWLSTVTLPTGGMLDGVYEGSGVTGSYIDFCVPNWIDLEPLKWIWIQINGVWDPGSEPFVEIITGEDSGDPVDGAFIDEVEVFPGFHRYEHWEMRPNPDVETIRVFIPDGSLVGQVVIDTISFPTPGAVALMAIGGVATARRRR